MSAPSSASARTLSSCGTTTTLFPMSTSSSYRAASRTGTTCAREHLPVSARSCKRLPTTRAAGKLVIGICNGFQVLCEAGLLPGALRKNEGLKFLCKWTELSVDVPGTPFTTRAERGQVLRVPINHFEGNWYADPDTLERMRVERPDRVSLREEPERIPRRRGRNLKRNGQRAGPDASSRKGLRVIAGLGGWRSDHRFDARSCDASSASTGACMTKTEHLHRDLGLTDDEFQAICDRIGREPSYTELAMFSVMWSEHCSYKSSRVHLKTLPTEGDRILVGPGEGAGIIEVADGVAVAWKIESHNHPSFVEPYNGAATGVGGIVRDILSMGARPIALMDPLRFGPLDDARTRYVVDGVVHGISSYGNSIGVPTVGGETVFEECYAENPLVNVACLGVVDTKLMHGRAEVPGQIAILFGSSTGRDGIGGASVLASAEFDEDSLDKRPSVQVGDPFSEKLLIECSLELIKRDLHRRVPGPRSRRDLVSDLGDDCQRRNRDSNRPRQRPPARDEHGAVRGNDQRVAGTHAGGRRTRARRRGARGLCEVGPRSPCSWRHHQDRQGGGGRRGPRSSRTYRVWRLPRKVRSTSERSNGLGGLPISMQLPRATKLRNTTGRHF